MHLRTKVKVEIVKKISQKKFPLKVLVIFSAEDHRSNIFVPVSASGNLSTHSWTKAFVKTFDQIVVPVCDPRLLSWLQV